MHLKRIELSGFKSFARPSALDFTTPVTAVVGPNGSGKSNIAEAIRFVLGEQSIKSLRGKKTEDLIFNGSHSAPRLNKASVEIIFDNSKRIFDMDYDEVSLRRTVYRDGEGIYAVNGTAVRLKDILELLAGVHIGASSHHIISQGEADRILLASPKDRRNMIEDALGLKIYQYKRIDSERKLMKTRENIERVEALRKEIAPHLKFLTNQVEKIQRAEKLKEDLKTLYAEYIHRENAYLTHQRKKIDDEMRIPEGGLKGTEEAIKHAEESLLKARTKSGHAKEVHGLERELQKIRGEKDAYGRRLGRLEGIIEYAEIGARRGGEEGEEDASHPIAIPRNAINDFEKEIASRISRAEGEEDITLVKKILHEIRGLMANFAAQWLRQKSIRAVFSITTKEELAGKKEEKRAVEESLRELTQKEEKLQEEYISLRNLVEEEKDSERTGERALFSFQNKRTELLSRIEVLRVKDEQLRSLDERFKNELREAEVLLGHAPEYTAAESEIFSKDSANEPREAQDVRLRKIERLKIKIEEIGVGGEEILKEYREVVERDQFLAKETDDLIKSAEALDTLIQELEEKIEIEFKDGVNKINEKFQELFALVFGGGKATLRLVAIQRRKKKEDDPSLLVDIENTGGEDEEPSLKEPDGVEISVSLPRKKVKSLEMLSGGERALASIALIFAMTQVKPPPFLILDETDAALDETNSRKYGEMLQSLSKHTQLVLITHNRETMGIAGVLYGVTALDGVSRLLSVRFDEAKELAQS